LHCGAELLPAPRQLCLNLLLLLRGRGQRCLELVNLGLSRVRFLRRCAHQHALLRLHCVELQAQLNRQFLGLRRRTSALREESFGVLGFLFEAARSELLFL
jgi:hypothetical protein